MCVKNATDTDRQEKYKTRVHVGRSPQRTKTEGQSTVTQSDTQTTKLMQVSQYKNQNIHA